MAMAARDMKAADGDWMPCAQLARDIEGAGKLVRLHADEGDHAGVAPTSAANRSGVDDRVALVVELELDIDIAAKNSRLGGNPARP